MLSVEQCVYVFADRIGAVCGPRTDLVAGARAIALVVRLVRRAVVDRVTDHLTRNARAVRACELGVGAQSDAQRCAIRGGNVLRVRVRGVFMWGSICAVCVGTARMHSDVEDGVKSEYKQTNKQHIEQGWLHSLHVINSRCPIQSTHKHTNILESLVVGVLNVVVVVDVVLMRFGLVVVDSQPTSSD